MKANTLKVYRSGVIYFSSACSIRLGIAGWDWLAVSTGEEHMLWKVSRLAISAGGGEHILRLRSSSGSTPRRACCVEFADKLAARFGEFKTLNLRYVICPGDAHGEGDSVLISVDNPPNAKPAPDSDRNRAIPEQEEEVEAREAYFAELEKSLGTISKPTEPPALGKPASVPRTRPLPENIPDWLRTPMSKGLHVEVAAIGREKHGWAIGAFRNTVSGNTLIAVYFDNILPCVMCFPIELSPVCSRLKPAVECYKVAGQLGIGLSARQIETINSGGVPAESHGLPDEMFE